MRVQRGLIATLVQVFLSLHPFMFSLVGLRASFDPPLLMWGENVRNEVPPCNVTDCGVLPVLPADSARRAEGRGSDGRAADWKGKVVPAREISRCCFIKLK